jgi:acetyltransferase-like isoleucine patch superfamily enzyme
VGAGALVAGVIEPYSIVLTQKGRVLKKRFSPDQIAEHEQILYGS